MSVKLEGALRHWGPKSDAPPEAETVIARAEAAVARIDTWGKRGLTDVSIHEIEAMAMVIAASDAIATLRARLRPESETTKGQAT